MRLRLLGALQAYLQDHLEDFIWRPQGVQGPDVGETSSGSIGRRKRRASHRGDRRGQGSSSPLRHLWHRAVKGLSLRTIFSLESLAMPAHQKKQTPVKSHRHLRVCRCVSCVHVCVHVCVCMCVYICVSMYAFTHMLVCVCVCVYACVYVDACMRACASVCVCAYVYAHVCVCVLYVYVYIYTYMCVYIRSCVYVYVRVCVCVSVRAYLLLDAHANAYAQGSSHVS